MLEDEGLTAICKVVIKDREALAALDPFGDTMLLTTLHWPDEIRSTEELDLPDEEFDFKPAELAMAKQLVSAMTGEFDPAQYKDEYREALEKVIEAKVEGKETVEIEEPEETRQAHRPDGRARGIGQSRPRRPARPAPRSRCPSPRPAKAKKAAAKKPAARELAAKAARRGRGRGQGEAGPQAQDRLGSSGLAGPFAPNTRHQGVRHGFQLVSGQIEAAIRPVHARTRARQETIASWSVPKTPWASIWQNLHPGTVKTVDAPIRGRSCTR